MDINRVYRVYVKRIWILLMLVSSLLASVNVQAQNENRCAIIEKKVFPFITCLKNSPELIKIINNNPELEKLTGQHKARIEIALKRCNDAGCYADALKWTQDETSVVASELVKLSGQDTFKSLISNLRESGSYNLYSSYDDPEFIRAVWNSVADGVAHIFDVYIKGKQPFYAAIDSISFGPEDKEFRDKINGMIVDELTGMGNLLSFEVPVNMALKALLVNQRDEAARYEPLDKGMNKSAYENIENIKWDKYKYSMILVPGQGPEKDGVAIDPMGISRCGMAAEYFKSGAAPFIIVSGGHVHPNQTPFCEAVEMKKYMIKELNIPEDAIFIEPHARHTTTNMRNAARMIYRFGIPADMKILVVTDPVQNNFLVDMEKRFIMELGCVPYRELNKLSENTSEYFPDRKALQCNPKDPLDP